MRHNVQQMLFLLHCQHLNEAKFCHMRIDAPLPAYASASGCF